MSDKALASEDINDSGVIQNQRNAPSTVDVGKYFLSVDEGGKQYSICLVKDCCRRFEGDNIENLKTHLNVAHYMNLHSCLTTNIDPDADTLTLVADEVESTKFPDDGQDDSNSNSEDEEEEEDANDVVAEDETMPDVSDGSSLPDNPNSRLLTSLHVREYFKIFAKNNKMLAKCLVNECEHTMAGNHVGNMWKHLNKNHQIFRQIITDTSIPIDPNVKHKDVRDYFHIFTENNKDYSKCLVTGCHQTFSGDHSGNMYKHLKRTHKMDILPRKLSRMAQKQARNYFRQIPAYGRTYSKCLMKGCEYRIASAQLKDLAMHLGRVHDMKLFSMSIGRCAFAKEKLSDRRNPLLPNEIHQNEFDESSSTSPSTSSLLTPQGGNEILFQANAPDTSKGVRDFFEIFTENDEVYAKCLVDECKVRMTGNHHHNLLKHLRRAHKMNHIQPRRRRPDVVKFPIQYECDDSPNRREYFETITENGKIFQKCLVADCGMRLSKIHSGNMMKHLQRVHNICLVPGKRLKSTTKRTPDLISLDNLVAPTVIEDDVKEHTSAASLDSDEGNRFRISKPSYARTYFRTFYENLKVYSECLVQDCTTRLSGNNASAMLTHLKDSHNCENLQLRKIPPKQPKHPARSHFRMVDDGGKVLAECMLCKRLLNGDHSGNLNKHLARAHNMDYLIGGMKTKKIQTKRIRRDPHETRKHFRTYTENGRIFSECLMENCNRRLRGKHLGSLALHLQRIHKKFCLVSKRKNLTRSKTETAAFQDNETHSFDQPISVLENYSELDHLGNVAKRKETKKRKLKSRSKTRMYFRTVNEKGFEYSYCLVENCNQRLKGSHLGNLAKHLVRRHNISDLYGEYPWNKNRSSSLSTDLIDESMNSIEIDEFQDNENVKTTQLPEKIVSSPMMSANEISNVERDGTENASETIDHPETEIKQIDDGSVTDHTMQNEKTAREFFRVITENEKVFAKCLVADCTMQLSGNRSHNMLMHLRRAHKMYDLPPMRSRKRTERYSARQHFRTYTENGQVFSDCLLKNCNQRMRGDHLGNLYKHLINRHKMKLNYEIDSCVGSTDGWRVDDEDTIENINESLNENPTEIDAFEDDDDDYVPEEDLNQCSDSSDNHETSTKKEIPSKERRNAENAFETDDARKYFETIRKGPKIFNKCLVNNCDRLMSGNHLNNLKKHLVRVHKISLVRVVRVAADKCCRLCFQKRERYLNIFQPKFNIAGLIRLHFPQHEVCYVC